MLIAFVKGYLRFNAADPMVKYLYFDPINFLSPHFGNGIGNYFLPLTLQINV